MCRLSIDDDSADGKGKEDNMVDYSAIAEVLEIFAEGGAECCVEEGGAGDTCNYCDGLAALRRLMPVLKAIIQANLIRLLQSQFPHRTSQPVHSTNGLLAATPSREHSTKCLSMLMGMDCYAAGE